MIGFYNIIKPTGVSSGYVVNKVKHIVKTKVGHLGTLDPLASGVVVVAVGKATKLFDYFLQKDKVYFALMKFGVLTDTLDCEGKILEQDNKVIALETVKSAAKSLEGEIEQMPPLYCARKVNGVRGYEAAKGNNEIDFKPRKTQIYSINVEKWHQNGVFALKIHCSAGTYVRSIVRDIAEKVGSVATTVAIIRLASGDFKLENSLLIDEIEKSPSETLIRLNNILKLPTINLDKLVAKRLADGKTISVDASDKEYLTFYNGVEFSLATCENGLLKNKIYLYEGEI